MLDIGFWEIVVIATVALLIVGPDKFPSLARQIGKLLSTTQRMFNNLKRDLKTELRLDEENSFKQHLDELDDLMKNAPNEKQSD